MKPNKIKEKVLEELEKYTIFQENPMEDAIDLTLAEVGKVIDKEISLRERNKEKELSSSDPNSRYIALCNEAIDTLNRIKQKLGIK